MANTIHLNSQNTPLNNTSVNRILRWPEVYQRVGICRSHVHNLVNKKQFPPPIKLGPRASGWLESEITNWLEQRIADSRQNNVSAE